jgi:ribosomal protein S1
MISIGDIVSARVVRVEPYGIFLQHDEGEIFIDIVNISWRGRIQTRSYTKPGDVLNVLVTGWSSPGRMNGSIRDIHPEDDPWRDPAIYKPGTTWTGRVKSKVDFGYFVELENGAEGLLRITKAGVWLELGQRVKLRLEEVDLAIRKLAFGLYEEEKSARSPASA